MEYNNKDILINEIKDLKKEISTNVERTIFMGYAASVGTLGLMIQYGNYNINHCFNYYYNFLNGSKLAQIVPITLLSIGVPLTMHSVKKIVCDSQKVKTKQKELKKINA